MKYPALRGVVEQMKDEAHWWSPAEVEFLNVSKDQAQVKISWSLREYRDGSKVMLNYQKPGEQKYTQIAAEEESKGLFSVILPVAIPQGPIINLHVEKAGNNKDSRVGNAVATQQVSSNANDIEMAYYILCRTGKQFVPARNSRYR